MADVLNELKAELRQRADEALDEAGNDRERFAAKALSRLATEDHDRLVRWQRWFEKKRSARLKTPEPMGLWLDELGPDCVVDVGKLDGYLETDKKLRILRDENGLSIEPDLVEAIHSVVHFAATTDPMDSWEKRPSRQKQRLLERTATLARNLASILDLPNGPSWPSAIELFEIKNVPRPLRLLLGKHPLAREMQPLKKQSLPSLLRDLEKWAVKLQQSQTDMRKKTGAPHARDMRKKTGAPHARVIARQTGFWFDHRYGSVPYEIVADIVNLLVPNLDPPATGKAVREWLGDK